MACFQSRPTVTCKVGGITGPVTALCFNGNFLVDALVEGAIGIFLWSRFNTLSLFIARTVAMENAIV